MPNASLDNASYLNLSTQKRDGSFVNTPVWFAKKGGELYIFSEGNAGKVKRIRNFSHVKVCPCTVTGKLTGQWQNAHAEILDKEQSLIAYKIIKKRYSWQMHLLDIGSKIAGKFNKRAFIKVTLIDET